MPPGQRHPADLRPGPRGAVLHPRVAARGRSPGHGCSTSTPAPGAVGLEALSRGADHVPARRVRRARGPHASATTPRASGCAGARGPRRERVERAGGSAARRRRRTTSCSSTRPTTSPTTTLRAVIARPARGGWLAAGALVVVERATRGGELALARRVRGRPLPSLWRGDALVRSRRAASAATRWPREDREREVTRASLRLPRILRPGDQRPPRHHRACRRLFDEVSVAVTGQQEQARHVRGRRAHGDAARGTTARCAT